MTDLEKVKIYIYDDIQNIIEQLRPIYSGEHNNTEIDNVNVGYLKGLAKAISNIEVVQGEDEDTSESEYELHDVDEPVLYQNGNTFELGIIKSYCGNNEYFVWYHTGDTAAKTHVRYLHKISNKYAFKITRLDTDGNERK